MAGLNCDPCFGTGIIGGINMHTPAWCLDGLWQLKRVAFRHEDREIPNEEGVDPISPAIHVIEHSLPLTIAGETDRLGNLYDNPYTGLYRNLDYLFDNIVIPPGSQDGTRIMVFNPPDDPPVSARIHVLDLRYGDPITDQDQGPVLVGTLEISVPSGLFT